MPTERQPARARVAAATPSTSASASSTRHVHFNSPQRPANRPRTPVQHIDIESDDEEEEEEAAAPTASTSAAASASAPTQPPPINVDDEDDDVQMIRQWRTRGIDNSGLLISTEFDAEHIRPNRRSPPPPARPLRQGRPIPPQQGFQIPEDLLQMRRDNERRSRVDRANLLERMRELTDRARSLMATYPNNPTLQSIVDGRIPPLTEWTPLSGRPNLHERQRLERLEPLHTRLNLESRLNDSLLNDPRLSQLNRGVDARIQARYQQLNLPLHQIGFGGVYHPHIPSAKKQYDPKASHSRKWTGFSTNAGPNVKGRRLLDAKADRQLTIHGDGDKALFALRCGHVVDGKTHDELIASHTLPKKRKTSKTKYAFMCPVNGCNAEHTQEPGTDAIRIWT